MSRFSKLFSTWMTTTLLLYLGVSRSTAQDGLPPLPLPNTPPTVSRPADAFPPSGAENRLPAPPTIDDISPTDPAGTRDMPRPNFLRRPLNSVPDPLPPGPSAVPRAGGLFRYPFLPPNGFAGPSSVIPREPQTSADFVPIEDRWRSGYPFWDRYGHGHRLDDDYPFNPGRVTDPFNQNVLKGDYPIAGQHTFLETTGQSFSIFEGRQVPTPTTPFEATERPGTYNFFGRNGQFIFLQFFSYSFDLFHGDAAFKPVDWRIKITPIFNMNNLSLQELGNTSPNTLQGTSRFRTFFTLQEWFVEKKIADLSSDYDFMSVRVGSQPFSSDFRNFLFADVNRAVRLFGTRNANRDQFNLAYFSQQEKDTNSLLNTFDNRHQNLIFANYYRQDFLFPGYTVQGSVNYDNDQPTVKYDKNRFLVRPDPVGVVKPHEVDVVYLGLAGDGHIGRYNLTHQFYWALGRDSMNPLANRAQNINGKFFAIEGSYDRDWVRFRTSFLYSSGDHNPNNGTSTGFDTIFNSLLGGGQQFAGGQFSFWQRQNLPLFGVNLVNRGSLIPDLRSSQIQGQANFVNPGLFLYNAGVDFDITPKLKMINNVNLLFFDSTAPLEQFLFAGKIDRSIGTDISAGFEYRPLVSDNVIMMFGVATLVPGQGLRALFNNSNNRVGLMDQVFLNLTLQY